jgi:hypothetical protein
VYMCTCNCPTPLQVYTTHIHGSNVCCPVHMLLGIYAARRTCCNSRRATDSVASVHYPYTRQQRMLPGAYAARHICCTAHMLLGAYAATVGAQQSAAAVATLDNISSSSRRRQQQWQHRRRRGHLYTYMLILLVMDIYIYKTFIYIYIYIYIYMPTTTIIVISTHARVVYTICMSAPGVCVHTQHTPKTHVFPNYHE